MIESARNGIKNNNIIRVGDFTFDLSSNKEILIIHHLEDTDVKESIGFNEAVTIRNLLTRFMDKYRASILRENAKTK